MLDCYEVKSIHLDSYTLDLPAPNFIETRSAIAWIKHENIEDLPNKS